MSAPVEPNGSRVSTADEEESLNNLEMRSISGDSEPVDRPGSPSPSTYTYASSIDGHTMLRDIAGRAVNATSDAYMLPADGTEHGRLDLQHECFKRKLGGLFLKPDAVRRALAPRQDITPAILDIGTGSGTWATDMARLKHYTNSFNVVHGRLIATGITNYRGLVGEVANMLRPGGVYLSMEVEMQIFDENYEAITATDEDEPNFSWLQKVMAAAYCAFKERSPGGIDAGPLIPRWLKSMDCWSDTGYKKIYIPIGAWDEGMNEKQRKTADMMKHDTLELMSSLRPLLLAHGYFAETIDKWLENAKEEIRPGKRKICWRLHYSWAIKKNDLY
ncbi:hypothetical protein FRB97_007287 [Tulasnella sp. 331]|nr:hypothetical protein FRB97_007287 [Tulasnella sp. 331]